MTTKSQSGWRITHYCGACPKQTGLGIKDHVLQNGDCAIN